MNPNSVLLAQGPHNLGGSFECIGGYCSEDFGNISAATGNVTLFITNLFGFFTTIAGLMFVLYFVLGGLKWISAGGDPQKVDGAKTQMTQAAIGVIVVVSAWAIAFIIGQVLGIDILNPEAILQIGPGSGSSTPPATSGP